MEKRSITISSIEVRIASFIAESLGIKVDQVSLETDVERYGLNSAVVVSLIGELEDWLGLELSPSILYEFPTVRAVSKHLHAQLSSD